MKPIYLIYAKTPKAVSQLEKEGAIQFSSDTFLWDEDPLSPHRAAIGKELLFDECTVLDIFLPDTPNDLRMDHPKKEEIKGLFSELHQVAFSWSRKHDVH